MSKEKYKLVIGTLSLILILMIISAFCLGRYNIPMLTVIKVLFSKIIPMDKTWSSTTEGVIFVLRMPRILASLLIGSAFVLSGATYQAIFKNPLVSPDLLGVSSGASVGAALMILGNCNKLEIQIGAFIGGIIAVLFATAIPRLLKNDSTMMLVLSGIIVSGMMSSIMGIIKYLADPDDELASITYWQMGSLAKVIYSDILAIMPVILIIIVVLLGLRWRINVLSLGEKEAKSLGIKVGFTRGIVVLCATVLTASSVCISGTIGWIGLVIPHLGRLLVGPDNVKLFPVSVILGGIFMLLIDTIARVLTNAELPLSILTGIIGAPFYFWLLFHQKWRF